MECSVECKREWLICRALQYAFLQVVFLETVPPLYPTGLSVRFLSRRMLVCSMVGVGRLLDRHSGSMVSDLGL